MRIFTTTLKCFIPLVGFEFSVLIDEQRVRLLAVKLEVNNFAGVTVHTGLGVSGGCLHLYTILRNLYWITSFTVLLKYETKRSILLNTTFQICNSINKVQQI